MRLVLQVSIFVMCFFGQAFAQTFTINDKIHSAEFTGSYYEFNKPVSDIKQAYSNLSEEVGVTKYNKIVRKYSKKPMWMAFTIKNSFDEQIKRIIQFPFGCTDEMELYVFDKDGNFEKIHRLRSTPIKDRDFEIRRLSASLDFAPQEEKLIIAKLVSSHQLSAIFDIYSVEKAYNYEKDYKVISILYVGVALGLFLYNLFIGTTSRKEYIFYYIGTLFLLSTLIMITADIPQYFGVVVPKFFHETLPFHRATLISVMTMFCLSFLNTKEILPKVHTIFSIFAVYVFVVGILTFVDDYYHLMNVLVKNLMTINLVMVLGLSLYVSLKTRSRSALLFTFATASLFISGIVYMLTWSFGLIPRNFMTANVILLGSAIEMILFSLAIADSFKEKIAQELKNRLKVENELKNLNRFLEKKVREKTNQLIDSKKRAALGELATGVAHEMNSPLSAVYNHLQYTQRLLTKGELNRDKLQDLNDKSARIVKSVFDITHKLKSYGESYGDITEENFNLDQVIKDTISRTGNNTYYTEETGIFIKAYKAHLNNVLSALLNVSHQLNDTIFISVSGQESDHIKIEISGGIKKIPSWIKNYLEIPFYEHMGESKGSGLELSLAKDAILSMQGKIEVASEEEDYLFRIYIPNKTEGKLKAA